MFMSSVVQLFSSGAYPWGHWGLAPPSVTKGAQKKEKRNERGRKREEKRGIEDKQREKINQHDELGAIQVKAGAPRRALRKKTSGAPN